MYMFFRDDPTIQWYKPEAHHAEHTPPCSLSSMDLHRIALCPPDWAVAGCPRSLTHQKRSAQRDFLSLHSKAYDYAKCVLSFVNMCEMLLISEHNCSCFLSCISKI